MNYRHAFHAGNFADVFKHILLMLLTRSFLTKENAFCYLDTHAGAGCYDLFSDAAQKTKEFETGVAKIMNQPNPIPEINDYMNCILALQTSPDELRYYPGSPLFVRYLLRPQDRMILSELHPEEHSALKKFLAHNPQIAIHRKDGYEGLNAFLPPKERRGLILIDPPFEDPQEFEVLLNALQLALKKWETGTYAIWYPIKDRQRIDKFKRKLREKIARPILDIEFVLQPEIPMVLNGCGMIIINAPWKFEERAELIRSWLKKTLSS